MRHKAQLLVFFLIGGVCGFSLAHFFKGDNTVKHSNQPETSKQFEPVSLETPLEDSEQRIKLEAASSEQNGYAVEPKTTKNVSQNGRAEDFSGEPVGAPSPLIVVGNSDELVAQKSWSQNRKADIESLIKEHNSEGVDFMIDKLIGENPYLTEHAIRQDPIEDEIWSIQMQQDLYLMLHQHQTIAAGLAVIQDLSCRQLTCEVIVVEHSPNVWMPVYLDTLGKLAAQGYSLDNDSPHNYQFTFENQGFVYNQFVFRH